MKLMTRVFMLLALSVTSCGMVKASEALKIKLKGTPSEVDKEIRSDFPFGISKGKVISILISKYGVAKGDITFEHIEKTPVSVTIEGRRYEEYSWVNATISKYHTFIFILTYVTMNFAFDSEGKLLSYGVMLTKWPDLM